MGNKGKVMTQQHIDNDTLGDFVKITSCGSAIAEDNRVENRLDNSMGRELYDDILDHLAGCEECRDQVSILNTLQNEWSQLRYQSSLTEEQQQMICDYIDGLLQADEAEKAKTLINDQPDAMKAALHYQSHVTSMAAELSRKEKIYQLDYSGPDFSEPDFSGQPSQGAFFAGVLSSVCQFFSIRSPMVYTMTATAALFVAVFLLMQSPETGPETGREQTVIASYQDNSTIQFTAKNKLPGVGFFAQSGNTSKPFEDIRVELISRNTIKISWPEVEGVELYKMRIQVFNQGKKTVLKESSTKANHTTFLLEPERKVFNANKRYEWVLYGNTIDDRMFYASGGFVISKAHVDNKAENNRDYDSW